MKLTWFISIDYLSYKKIKRHKTFSGNKCLRKFTSIYWVNFIIKCHRVINKIQIFFRTSEQILLLYITRRSKRNIINLVGKILYFRRIIRITRIKGSERSQPEFFRKEKHSKIIFESQRKYILLLVSFLHFDSQQNFYSVKCVGLKVNLYLRSTVLKIRRSGSKAKRKYIF